MNKKNIIIVVIIILVFGGIAFYTSKKADRVEFSEERKQAIEDAIKRPVITINAKHQYRNGEHTFLGSFEIPTPCHSYNAEVIKREAGDGSDEPVTEIALSYQSTDQVCTEVIAEREFKVSFEGEQDDNVIATLNGELVNFNIFEVGPDEDISEIEIFIKG